jgi:hypothetical protein
VGDALTVADDGSIRFVRSTAKVPPRAVEVLIGKGLIVRPLPPLPLFDEPARLGCITAAGRVALNATRN